MKDNHEDNAGQQDQPDSNELQYEAMDEQAQALSYMQSVHSSGMCGLQDLTFPIFFREVFEKR